MGGIGSGRRNQSGKMTTNNCHSFDVRRLQKEGLLTPGHGALWSWMNRGETVSSIQVRAEADRVTLKYQHQNRGEPWQPMEYPVLLDWTGCTFGGKRAWFRCPAWGCGRRVALLYVGRSGIFACRHCNQLAYASQREAADDRAARRASTIRRRLGWPPGMLTGGWKPKGMHWKTYWQLRVQHAAFVGVSLEGVAKRLGLLNRQIAGLRVNLKGKN